MGFLEMLHPISIKPWVYPIMGRVKQEDIQSWVYPITYPPNARLRHAVANAPTLASGSWDNTIKLWRVPQ